jgi:hypothetical protein
VGEAVSIRDVRNYLTGEQVELLLKPIHPQRVLQLKGMSYVEGYDIRAELNRVFGFGRWSLQTLEQSLVCEEQVKTNAGKPAWYVVYKSHVRLSIYLPDGHFLTHYDGSHVGESTHPVRGEAHGNALTNSETYALRRAAINLGDQFGLSLYRKGSLEPIVRWTLVGSPKADTDDVPAVTPEEQSPPGAGTGEDEPPKVTRSRTVSRTVAQTSQAKTPQEYADLVGKCTDMGELREIWKSAGTAGFLQSQIMLTAVNEDGEKKEEKMTLQECLLRRSNELGFPKSDSGSGGGGSSGERLAGVTVTVT